MEKDSFHETYINTTSQFSPAVILNNTNEVNFASVSFIVNESPIIKIIGLPETSCGTIRFMNSVASISGELQDDSVTIDGTNYSLSKTPFLVVDGCDLDASEFRYIDVSEEYYWVELINGATISNVGAMTYDNGLIVKDNGTYRKL